MAELSRYAQREMLDHLLGASWTAPANVYVALFTAAPSDVGGGTEVSGNDYARKLHNAWNAATDASPCVATNDGAITFDPANGGNWGTVTHFALFDALTAGNMLGWSPLTANKDVDDGDTAEFADTVLQLTLD